MQIIVKLTSANGQINGETVIKEGIITKEQFNSMQNICKKGKHKFRTNQYGVTLCVRCGLLGSESTQQLTKEEILVIK